MTVNKSKLFKMAWKAFKSGKVKNNTFSKCLKWAWKVIRQQKDEQLIVEPKRETAKSFMFDVKVVCNITEQEMSRGIWLPKSMIRDGIVPSWFIEKKIKELREMISYAAKLDIEFNGKHYYL